MKSLHRQPTGSGCAHIFASLAQMGGKTIRGIGLARVQFGLTIKSAVYNLKRMSSLLQMARGWLQADCYDLHYSRCDKRQAQVFLRWRVLHTLSLTQDWVFRGAL